MTTEQFNVQYVITIGKIFRADAIDAKNELNRLFTALLGKKVNDLPAESSSRLRVLNISDFKFY